MQYAAFVAASSVMQCCLIF